MLKIAIDGQWLQLADFELISLNIMYYFPKIFFLGHLFSVIYFKYNLRFSFVFSAYIF